MKTIKPEQFEWDASEVSFECECGETHWMDAGGEERCRCGRLYRRIAYVEIIEEDEKEKSETYNVSDLNGSAGRQSAQVNLGDSPLHKCKWVLVEVSFNCPCGDRVFLNNEEEYRCNCGKLHHKSRFVECKGIS